VDPLPTVADKKRVIDEYRAENSCAQITKKQLTNHCMSVYPDVDKSTIKDLLKKAKDYKEE
jgi:hypothetical protein